MIDYKNQVTGKTSLDLNLARQINAFISDSSSDFISTATLTARWEATYKITVAASYSWSSLNYPGQGNTPPGSDRLDHMQYTTLTISYQPLRWLIIYPYAHLQTRTSNFVGANFNAFVYGLSFTTHWRSAEFPVVTPPGLEVTPGI